MNMREYVSCAPLCTHVHGCDQIEARCEVEGLHLVSQSDWAAEVGNCVVFLEWPIECRCLGLESVDGPGLCFVYSQVLFSACRQARFREDWLTGPTRICSSAVRERMEKIGQFEDLSPV